MARPRHRSGSVLQMSRRDYTSPQPTVWKMRTSLTGSQLDMQAACLDLFWLKMILPDSGRCPECEVGYPSLAESAEAAASSLLEDDASRFRNCTRPWINREEKSERALVTIRSGLLTCLPQTTSRTRWKSMHLPQIGICSESG
jgi:hypothetical protein